MRSLRAGRQQALGDGVTAGPAGHLGDTVHVEHLSAVALLSPAPQQAWGGTGLPTEGQHPQGGPRRQHLLPEHPPAEPTQQSGRHLGTRNAPTRFMVFGFMRMF